MRNLLLTVALTGLALTGAAAAQEYSSDAVLDFFIEQVDLGAKRSLCVGTAEECAEQNNPGSFDVLVNFELDSAELTPDALTNLTQVAVALKDDRLRDAKFLIEGHTDARGSDNYNATLADARAASVAEFLISQGVSTDRMTALGMGESAPRVPDPFDPVNRRVEMRLNLE